MIGHTTCPLQCLGSHVAAILVAIPGMASACSPSIRSAPGVKIGRKVQ